jgi:predicted RND superfamily exporter protein
LPQDQEAKLALLAKVRAQIDRHLSLLAEDERQEALAWRPPEYLRKLGPDDLPEYILTAFTEVDGTRGRLVGIDVEYTHYKESEGRDLLILARSMEVEALGQKWVAASAQTIFAGMLNIILSDGPRVTIVALSAVTLLLLVAFGWRGAMPVLASLLIGIVWLGGAAAVSGQKLNFLNFVALPITLGVAADYGANIWARMRKEGPDKIRDVIVETGSAVALCSATTVIGYSSLLLAHNGALRSFGILAVIGEITCLFAALMVLPAVLRRR